MRRKIAREVEHETLVMSFVELIIICVGLTRHCWIKIFPEYAFQAFPQSIPGVTMILSGMSNEEQLEKNLVTFAEDRKLNEAEKQPSACLKCRSCEQVCPQQIKISEVLADFSGKLG